MTVIMLCRGEQFMLIRMEQDSREEVGSDRILLTA